MLHFISVKNFAIIENIEVSFEKGMTSLTGETGAGKSLLIDAIGLLLGDRATSNVVRSGEDKAVVEGVFHYQNKHIDLLLEEYGLEPNGELIIKRQITPSNNNVIKVNGTTVTLQQLRLITNQLADIHTQHDTHRLINQDTYLDIIDGFDHDHTSLLKEQYQESVSNYKKELKELKRLESSNDDLLERLDLMKFQKEELESYQLDIDEEQELEERISKMENFDKIYQVLHQTKTLLEANFAIERIYDASKELKSVSTYHDTYDQLQRRFEGAYFELDDTLTELSNEIDSLDFDPRELDKDQERLNDLNKIKRKYRKELPELIDYLEKITKDIENIDHYDDLINDQKERVIKAFKKAKEDAERLHQKRLKVAAFIETELLQILEDLELKKAQFSIVFEEHSSDDFRQSSQFLENGTDVVDFYITTNVGEPLKPLSKSASGGEMSRIMLGLKNLLVQSLQLSLIIFDEIDTGVSGFVASQVAKKMHEISTSTQVICITHIPQVAATSDHHLFISKHVEQGRTKAQIKTLRGEERVHEIATMISGAHVSDAAIESAKELLK